MDFSVGYSIYLGLSTHTHMYLILSLLICASPTTELMYGMIEEVSCHDRPDGLSFGPLLGGPG